MGYEWYVELYPGGLEPDRNDYYTQVAMYLFSQSKTKNIHIDCKIDVRSNNKIKDLSHTHEFVPYVGTGVPRFIVRNIALQHLIHEALVIEVRMKPGKYPPPFIPDNPSDCSTLKKSFMDEDFADIVFHVGGEEIDARGITEQGIKDSATKFYAHRIILKHAAPLLAELGATSETSPASV